MDCLARPCGGAITDKRACAANFLFFFTDKQGEKRQTAIFANKAGYNTRMPNVITKLIFSLLLIATAAAPPNVGELISVYAEGLAEVHEGNLLEARNSAREMAVKQALWSVVHTLVSSEEAELNTETIERLVSSDAMRYVQSYKYIEEAHDEQTGLYTVALELTLFYDYLRKTLNEAGLTVEGGSRLKVVVVIDERTISAVPDSGFLLLPSATEESIKESVGRLGYYIIDRKQIRALKDDGRVLKAVRGDTDSLLWLGGQFDASYIIAGSARSKSHPSDGTNPPWVEGEIDAAVYDGRNGAVLWRDQVVERLESGSGTAGFRAIRMAGKIFDSRVVDFIYSRTR